MKVSVIMPAYNAQESVSTTLDALVSQTFHDLEIILVDDGSTDGTFEIMEAYAKRHDFVHVYHIKNGGVYNARLEGIKHAHGDYVAFCDADDLPLPYMIERMVQKASQSNADMVVCGFVREEMQTGRILSREMMVLGSKTYDLNTEASILPIINTAVWNKMIRLQLVRQAMVFKQPPRILEDMMFLCSLYPIMDRVAFIPEVLYRYRVHKGSAMSVVKDEELGLLKQNMIETRDWVYAHKDSDMFRLSCDSMAFIHFGLSVVIRQVQGGAKIGKSVQAARVFLKANFPQYGKTGIGLTWNIFHKNILLKPLLARYIFCLHLMSPALMVYNLITQKLKIEIKW